MVKLQKTNVFATVGAGETTEGGIRSDGAAGDGPTVGAAMETEGLRAADGVVDGEAVAGPVG
mgnify:CR=1 FL=1